MDTVTRRRFLIASGVVGGTALAAGTVGVVTLSDLFDTARWNDKPSDAKTLVLITLYGGNDGLNTVVPYADKAYHDARPELAFKAEEVLRLDDSVGLNPGLKGFHALYQSKKLAIVRGVGYPRPDRSHFRSMDIWQTAQPERPGNTGWVGRWLDATPGSDPRHAVSFEPALPPVLAGETMAGAAVTINGVKLPAGITSGLLTALGRPVDGEPALQARASRAFADLVEVDAMVRGLPDDADEPDAADRPMGTPTGGRTSLAAQLGLVARCIEAGVATRVYSASLGGFDTHADEKPAQEGLLTELDKSVTAFVERMQKSEAGRKVVVAIYSEFGRRVRANASDGTDHGTASDVFLLGAGVHGGQYGTPASLTDLDDGDLKFTTDFRDVYATLVERVLDSDPGRVLAGWKGRLDKVL